ncbi:beta-galactosidase 3-like [Cucumis melo var. makuwa]|uniref:Beta-galactosidase 3-like n=1 Tax=Cucumis melo var. makuwa TaxID=1194695 RepID=A0A5D3BYS5_CUCMM|nr:beta-galactosidase 3-like [Cucumis melo var. makuwa]TYK04134.1 beta-galactosidase 3-like [Cucumis melo var. makuwa]
MKYKTENMVCVLLQIEIDYGTDSKLFGEVGHNYMTWTTNMAIGLQTGVPWVMCKKKDALNLVEALTFEKEATTFKKEVTMFEGSSSIRRTWEHQPSSSLRKKKEKRKPKFFSNPSRRRLAPPPSRHHSPPSVVSVAAEPRRPSDVPAVRQLIVCVVLSLVVVFNHVDSSSCQCPIVIHRQSSSAASSYHQPSEIPAIRAAPHVVERPSTPSLRTEPDPRLHPSLCLSRAARLRLSRAARLRQLPLPEPLSKP